MKIDTAYLCTECQEIQTCAPKGACFVCGSEEIFPLSWLLRKRSERAQWLKRVNGGKRVERPSETAAMKIAYSPSVRQYT
ncbi:MAG TPA: hypothetical protein VL754_09745 [Verrucomicrobiae bacterium]|jgi:hypothetical protein|nr:hypothetical protein [Verrucomicrobiae bacterium]